MLPPADGYGVVACEVCDQPVCLRCHPDVLAECAGEPIYHCGDCARDCPACQQDLADAMGADHDR